MRRYNDLPKTKPNKSEFGNTEMKHCFTLVIAAKPMSSKESRNVKTTETKEVSFEYHFRTGCLD
jgi:hypothetical protein